MKHTNKTLENVPRFDWMQETIHDDPETVFELLSGTLGGTLEPARGLNGYHRSMLVKREGETLARVMYGGPNGWPNVVASGAATDDVAPVTRGAWELREVTRMDSAQDFDGEAGYESVRDQMRALAERVGIAQLEMESIKNGARSRTFYLGSASSRVRVRLYEKGMFEHQLGNAEASPNWYRLEVQIRPTGDARWTAANLDASEAWGFSRWTRELAEIVMGVQVDQITMQQRRDPDYLRAMKFAAKQYGATFREAIEVEGSWEAVGRMLGVVQ